MAGTAEMEPMGGLLVIAITVGPPLLVAEAIKTLAYATMAVVLTFVLSTHRCKWLEEEAPW